MAIGKRLARAMHGRISRAIHQLLFKSVSVGWSWPVCDDAPGTWESVAVPGHERETLAGLFGVAEGRPLGVVVCAHPTTQKAKGYFLETGLGRALRQAGFHVLLFDFNGFGESPRVGYDYWKDVVAAGHEAARRAPGLPVGLLGVCFGASYGICALARPDHPFSAAVLDAPYLSAGRILRAMATRARRPRLMRLRAAVLTVLTPLRPSLEPLLQVRRMRGVRRVLLISGEADAYVPPAHVARFERALPKGGVAAEHWTVPGAAHLESFATAPEAYAARVAVAFRQAWKTAPTRRVAVASAAPAQGRWRWA